MALFLCGSTNCCIVQTCEKDLFCGPFVAFNHNIYRSSVRVFEGGPPQLETEKYFLPSQWEQMGKMINSLLTFLWKSEAIMFELETKLETKWPNYTTN